MDDKNDGLFEIYFNIQFLSLMFNGNVIFYIYLYVILMTFISVIFLFMVLIEKNSMSI